MSRVKAAQTRIEFVGIKVSKENISKETLETGVADSKWKSTLLDLSKISLFQFGIIRRMEASLGIFLKKIIRLC